MFEISEGQSEKVKNILERNNFKNIEIIYDFNNLDRIVTGVMG